MFQFRNGRLYAAVTPQRLSFKLPEGFWIETIPDALSDDFINLRSEDCRILIEVGIGIGNHMENGTESELTSEFDTTPKEELEGPFPITVDSGISGHCIYSLSYPQQYVIHLDVGRYNLLAWLTEEEDAEDADDWVDRVFISITIEHYEGNSLTRAKELLQEAVGNPGVQELIQSVMFEPKK